MHHTHARGKNVNEDADFKPLAILLYIIIPASGAVIGAVIGGIIGAILIIVVVIGVVYLCRR